MKKQLKKVYSMEAPVSKVWEALTTPELIKQYFFGTEAISDWKEGSAIIYQGEWEGKPYQDKGKILKLVPGKLLTVSYWSSLSGKADTPENYSEYSYELKGAGNKTQLTLSQEDNFVSAQARNKAWEHWDVVMDGLKKLVEKYSVKHLEIDHKS
jgi:uncharacterized protein YndB with AHSA1/START domain